MADMRSFSLLMALETLSLVLPLILPEFVGN